MRSRHNWIGGAKWRHLAPPEPLCAKLLAKLLPDAKFVSLPGAGHNDTFNGDFFRAVVNAMSAFLKE